MLPSITVRINDAATARRLLVRPQREFGEAYVRGSITIENGTLRDLLRLAAHQQQLWHHAAGPALKRAVRSWAAATNYIDQLNSTQRSLRNVRHHYDIGNRVFELFLDPAMQYTCAYFPAGALPAGTDPALHRYFENRVEDLDQAQRRRMDHMMSKLGLSAGMSVLDVGCGWGGFALEMARTQNVSVLGISLSAEQLKYAEESSRKAGLQSRVQFELLDYRNVEGRFDRIVAAGVLEHIGKPHFKSFFRKLASLLKPDGVILIDSTGRVDGPGGTNTWLRKYIYPGGYIPALSEIQRAVESSSLELYDVEVFRIHYAMTVREWERRFTLAAGEITALMGAEFVRMWQLYLAASEMSFVYGRYVNFQLQLSNSRFSLPITRDYLT